MNTDIVKKAMTEVIKHPVKSITRRIFGDRLWLVLLTSFATALGAMGGFPRPPIFFKRANDKYPILQWLLLYILVLQGGGQFDIIFAAISTFAIFLIYKLIIWIDRKNEERRKKRLNDLAPDGYDLQTATDISI